MNKPSLQVITLGCSKNTVDTEHILACLEDSYDIVPEQETVPVDYLLINTCGFIGDAKEESVQTILEAAKRKEAGEIGQLYVFGCMSERYAHELPELIPEVDKWFGVRDFRPIVKALGVDTDPMKATKRHNTGASHFAYLKIAEGCDRRCSYCAIPFIRGKHISRPMEEILEEARGLAERGVKELIVIAQDTTFYGLDLYHRRALAELLQKLSEIDGIEWIRIHYSYPADFPEDVIDQMAHNPKVCRYMDIPLQHIADSVLDDMHRHVTGEWTRNLISRMRAKVPGVALRTTMIVGFPGETEENFQELLDFIKEAKFDKLGAFTYSEEEGTFGAEHLEDNIPQEVKDERYNRLMELQSSISLECNLARVGEELKVIVDDYMDGVFVCRSEYDSPEVDGEVLVKYDSAAMQDVDPYSVIGDFLQVKITGADEYDLIADFIDFD